MALIHDDKIEELGRELLIDVLLLLDARVRLVERVVHVGRFINRTIGDLGHCLTKRLGVVGLGLIGEDITIDEEADPLLGARLPQALDDLKRRVGLPCAGGHD